MGSGRIRLSGFAGTSHYERGSVMDSDFLGESNSGSVELFQSPNGRRFCHECIFLGLRLGLVLRGHATTSDI